MQRGRNNTSKAWQYLWQPIILMPLLLLGCSTAPTQKDSGPIFYPPLPNPPRIQFLKTFTNRSDISRSSSTLAKFIAGDENTGTSLVNKPYGVAIFDGIIYVADTRGSGYTILDLVKHEFRFNAGTVGGRFKKPINITIDQEGNKFITDTGRNQVLVYDRNEKFVRAYGKKGQFVPADVAVTRDRLYIADVKKHKIHVLDRLSGKYLKAFDGSGSKESAIHHPTNLDIADDKLYVSDTSNFRVQQFTLDGKYIRSYGSVGSELGKFARPKGVAVDRDKRIYVVDAAFENVQLLRDDGKLLMFFGSPGDKRGNINLPTAITLDYDNVALFQNYAAPDFKIEYLILVASQFGVNKVNVYGFGKMQGMDYPRHDDTDDK